MSALSAGRPSMSSAFRRYDDLEPCRHFLSPRGTGQRVPMGLIVAEEAAHGVLGRMNDPQTVAPVVDTEDNRRLPEPGRRGPPGPADPRSVVWISRRNGGRRRRVEPVRREPFLGPGSRLHGDPAVGQTWLRRCRLISTILASLARCRRRARPRPAGSGLRLERLPHHAHHRVALGLRSSVWSARNCEPRFEVKIKIVLRKSTAGPGRR